MQHDAEVSALLSRASDLTEMLRGLRYQPSGDTSHSWHMAWRDRAGLLARHLSAALALEAIAEYASAFAVIRTALEHHLTDRLIIAANRYEHELTAPSDEAADKLEREYRLLVTDPDSDVQSVRRLRGRRLRVMRHAPRFTEARDQWLSMQSAWADRYNPFTGRERHLEHVEAPFMDLAELKAQAREAGELWERIFSFRGLRTNLTMNGLLTPAELLQVELHYAFLSAFAHPTNAGYEEAFGRDEPRTAASYDHYCSELVALYVIRLVGLEVKLVIDGLRRPPACGLVEWDVIEAALDRAATEIDYFWFLGGGPTDADRARAANHLMYRANRERPWEAAPVDPASLEPGKMPYPRNPLRRLVQLHESWTELMTHVGYRSPWERPDARFR